MALKYRKFMRSTQRVSPTSINNSQHPRGRFRVQSAYDADREVVTFQCYVASFTRPGIRHIVRVEFLDVPADQLYQDEDSVEDNRERNGGQLIPIPVLGQNEMKVRCSCPSFRFTGSEAAQLYGSFIGGRYHPWRPNRTGRAPRNPHNEPMLCKHIIAFIEFLWQQGYVRYKMDSDLRSHM